MGAGPLLVVLTGPSGVGKDSILERLRSLPDRPYSFGVNATTRPPRSGEQDGVDYFFVSREQFARMVAEDELLEHASVYGQDKGVPKAPVRKLLAEGKDVLFRTDVQGARYIKSVVPEAVTVFIAPPSFEELERRVRERGGDTAEQLAVRLSTTRREMDAADEFDHVVVNDDLDRCVREIDGILRAEHTRPDRGLTRIP